MKLGIKKCMNGLKFCIDGREQGKTGNENENKNVQIALPERQQKNTNNVMITPKNTNNPKIMKTIGIYV